MPHKERFNATKKKKAAKKQPTDQLSLTPSTGRSRTRSAAKTDNAFAAILDASRRGVSTEAIEATFGDAFGRRKPKPVIGDPVSRAPIDRGGVILPVNPGGGPRDLGAERRILPIDGLQAERRPDSRANVEIGNPGVDQPNLSINDLRRARGAAAKARAEAQTNANRARAEGGVAPSSVQRPGIQRIQPAIIRPPSPNRDRDLRRAFTKAGGQQAIDRSFAAAGGRRSFNARTGKRSNTILDPRTGNRRDIGSIRVNLPTRKKRTSSSQDSTAEQRNRAQRNAAVSRRHARQLENRKRSEAARRR